MLIKKRVHSIHQQKMPKSFRLQPFFRIVTTVAKMGARYIVTCTGRQNLKRVLAFQASGLHVVWKGKDLASWIVWKSSKISQSSI